MFRSVLIMSAMFCLSPPMVYGLTVSEVSFRQTEDDEVVVSYRLEGMGKCRVELLMSRDGGLNYTLRPRSVRGDVGEDVDAGGIKRIVWDVLGDFPRLAGDDIVFKVVAIKQKEYEFNDEILIQIIKKGEKYVLPDRENMEKLQGFVIEQMYKAGKIRYGASPSEAKKALVRLAKEKGWRPEIRDGRLHLSHYERIGVIFERHVP